MAMTSHITYGFTKLSLNIEIIFVHLLTGSNILLLDDRIYIVERKL